MIYPAQRPKVEDQKPLQFTYRIKEGEPMEIGQPPGSPVGKPFEITCGQTAPLKGAGLP
jgi:hypothetical protein